MFQRPWEFGQLGVSRRELLGLRLTLLVSSSRHENPLRSTCLIITNGKIILRRLEVDESPCSDVSLDTIFKRRMSVLTLSFGLATIAPDNCDLSTREVLLKCRARRRDDVTPTLWCSI